MEIKISVKKVILPLMLAMFVVTGNAQIQRNAYFLDRHAYRWQLNPALLPDWGFLSFTPLGHWGLDLQSNVGISDFLYPRDGKLYTFMDKDAVSEKTFSSKLPHTTTIRFNIEKWNILSFGFFAWGGYNVFGLDFSNNMRLEIPKDFFMLPKRNIGGSYDLSGLGIRDEAYLTLSLGHARKFKFGDYEIKNLTVGANLKVLLGAASVQAKLVDSYANLQNDDPNNPTKIVSARLNAEAMASAIFKLNWKDKLDKDGNLKMDNIGDILNMSFNGLGGWGLGIDLGATYDMAELKLPDGHKLQLSAAITDLAFIRWNDQIYARNSTPIEVSVDVMEGIGGDNFKIDSFVHTDIGDIYLKPKAGTSRTTALNANLRLGAEYWVAKYVSFGLLSTTRFSGKATTTELMVTANIKPKWFNFVLNTAISNWGPSWGLYLGWAPRYFANLFLSIDYLPYRFAGMYGIPADNVSLSVNMGASIPLNRNPDRVAKIVDGAKSMELQNSDIEGGNAIEWQKSNNEKNAGRIKKNPVTIKGARDIDNAEKKELERLNKPIANE
jgi:hypothetical protein